MAAIESIQSCVAFLSRTFSNHAHGVDRQAETRMHSVDTKVASHEGRLSYQEDQIKHLQAHLHT
eukprot:7640230-Pyramimonas_sp.AAC.1